MKKIFNLLVGTLAAILLTSNAFAADTKGLIIDGRTLVPVRGVFEELGFNVIWDAETKTAFLSDDNYTVKIQNGATTFTTNSETITPEVPQQNISGSFYLPLRAIGDSIGATTDWDNEYKVAIINYNDKKAYVFCGDTTSSDYPGFSSGSNESTEPTTAVAEPTTEATTAESVEVQSLRNISVEVEDDKSLKVSFLPDEVNDYSKVSEQIKVSLSKTNKLIYEDTMSINVEDNNNYVEFTIPYSDLNSAIVKGDLKSYSRCVLNLELLANDKVYAVSEYTFDETFTYQSSYSNGTSSINVSQTDVRTDMRRNMTVRFEVSCSEAAPKLLFVSYDLAGKKLGSVPVVIKSSGTFAQDYLFSGDTATIKIEADTSSKVVEETTEDESNEYGSTVYIG